MNATRASSLRPSRDSDHASAPDLVAAYAEGRRGQIQAACLGLPGPVIGDTANTSARLCGVASAGQILVSEATAARLGVSGRWLLALPSSYVAGVQVSIVGTTLGALTSAEGTYLVRGIPAGAATVRLRRLGFEPVAEEQAPTMPVVNNC